MSLPRFDCVEDYGPSGTIYRARVRIISGYNKFGDKIRPDEMVETCPQFDNKYAAFNYARWFLGLDSETSIHLPEEFK